MTPQPDYCEDCGRMCPEDATYCDWCWRQRQLKLFGEPSERQETMDFKVNVEDLQDPTRLPEDAQRDTP